MFKRARLLCKRSGIWLVPMLGIQARAGAIVVTITGTRCDSTSLLPLAAAGETRRQAPHGLALHAMGPILIRINVYPSFMQRQWYSEQPDPGEMHPGSLRPRTLDAHLPLHGPAFPCHANRAFG